VFSGFALEILNAWDVTMFYVVLDTTPDFPVLGIPSQTHRIVSACELFDQMLRES
jgi:hypothetical protein